ncbi:putative GMC oxidoreductase [Xylaria telfairii]|nr:putative GMC oxidoreductase [Xylaria telfairii]
MWVNGGAYPLRRVEEVIGREYDYIVVGGGTAGSALASRLSESPETTVLLLERGPFDDSLRSRIPLASAANGSYVVNRSSIPEPQTGDQPVSLLFAETLGGTSRINGMVYTRGAPAYFERWSQHGFDWGWAHVKPYFEKVEQIVSLRQTSHLESAVHPFLAQSAHELGLLSEEDPNQDGSFALGYLNFDLTIDQKGNRHSAFHAYLPRDVAIQRQSVLHICTDVIVSHLDVDGRNGIARGVYLSSSKADQPTPTPHFVSAKREIILTAGAICTPQILQLSGIGPEALLNRVGIPIARNLPGVGARLSDHILLPISFEVPIEDSMQQLQVSVISVIKNVLLYAIAGKGWLKSAIDRGIFFSTSHIDDETGLLRETKATGDPFDPGHLPDAEIIVLPIGTVPAKNAGRGVFTLQLCLTQPSLASTGDVVVQSVDAKQSPQIRLNMLRSEEDQRVARKALRFTLRLAEQFVFRSGYPKSARMFQHPATDSTGGEWTQGSWSSVSDASLDDYIRKNMTSSYHLTSSCYMGKEEDGGVVDGQLRVHGFPNLRIADASILPTAHPAHPMASVYMVAERCADFVKERWR